MSLAPNFVLWAVICFTLVLLGGAIAWLSLHELLIRLLRRLWLSDIVFAWLVYAAAYHLLFLEELRIVLGRPWAVWGLCAALLAYLLLQRLPTPLRTPPRLFVLALLVWGGVLAAGERYVDEMQADADRLATEPQTWVSTQAPTLRPLQRVLLLTRVEPDTLQATGQVLAMLQGTQATDAALLSAYRLTRLPLVLDHYERDLSKLRTYQWLQVGLMTAVLLLWAYGRVPDWEAL